MRVMYVYSPLMTQESGLNSYRKNLTENLKTVITKDLGRERALGLRKQNVAPGEGRGIHHWIAVKCGIKG